MDTITPDQLEAGKAIMASGATATRSPSSRVNPDTIGNNLERGSTVDSGAYKAENGLYYNSDGSPAIGSPEQAKDRVDATAAKYTSQAQQLTDLINAKYTTKVANDKDLIASNDARARVLNTRTGTTGSATGDTAVSNIQEKGNKVLAADEASRVSEISAALGKVSALQDSEQKANEAASRNDLVTANNLRAKNKTDSLATLKTLGASGPDMETFKTKEPDAYQALLKSTGLSPVELEAYYNNAKGTKFQSKIEGNTFISYGTDPKTGKPIVQTQTIAGLDANTYEPTPHYTEGGKMFFVPKNWNGDASKILWQNGAPAKTGAAAKPNAPVAKTSAQKNEEQDALNWLALQAGFDPKTDIQRFQNDPTARAWAIQQAKLAKQKTKTSGGRSI